MCHFYYYFLDLNVFCLWLWLFFLFSSVMCPDQLAKISCTRIEFKAWISNYILTKLWNLIARPYPNSNSGLTQLGQGWVFTSHENHGSIYMSWIQLNSFTEWTAGIALFVWLFIVVESLNHYIRHMPDWRHTWIVIPILFQRHVSCWNKVLTQLYEKWIPLTQRSRLPYDHTINFLWVNEI